MGMVAPTPRIASAFYVLCGSYGDVRRYAQQRGVCRQWIYREAALLTDGLTRPTQQLAAARAELQQLRQENSQLRQRLARAVVIDDEKQAEVATVGQARGVPLADCRALLEVLIPGQVLSRATLGRRTQAAGQRAGALLEVLDEVARQQVREVAADEIYVKRPVLMTIEPDSLCWLGGRLAAEASGAAWRHELAALPHLRQVTRDGGTALAKGVALVNARRQAGGQAAVVDQGDHFHALRGGNRGVRLAEAQARRALAEAVALDRRLAAAGRRGQKKTAAAVRAHFAWQRAEQAMDTWQAQERAWQQTKEALRLFTPAGELNTRAQAEAVLAQTLPQLPDGGFAKVKRQLRQAEMLSYLDRVEQQLAALPVAEELKQAAVRQEGLRRRPDLLRGETGSAAALRGVWLVCAAVLAKAGEAGQQAVTEVAAILRCAYRASSLVECINGVLRMHQAGHRRMTQGLIDLKRLYWNGHRFESGRRRGTTPYQRLGISWPEGLRWWELLKMTPEQLRDRLSTTKKAA